MHLKQKLSYIVIISVILIGGCIQNDTILEQEDAVLRGKVTIGPLCPVEPCELPPEQIARIYEARKVIIYEQDAEIKITEMNLNQNGEYSLSLKPGNYIVDITDAEGNELPLDLSKRSQLGNAIPKEVELKAGDKVIVDFDIDTGIRSITPPNLSDQEGLVGRPAGVIG